MRLLHIQKLETSEKVRLVGTVQLHKTDQTIELYFEYPQAYADYVNESADAFVPALLLPCMEKGESLIIEPPVSQKLLSNLSRIQDIFHQWHPKILSKVTVSATKISKQEVSEKSLVGSFFSLGVDSFYTLHKHLYHRDSRVPSITHLIHIKGIEFPLSYYTRNREAKVNERIQKVAKETGLEVIFGETNIRSHFPLKWGLYYHGAGLASVALSLSDGFKSVLIPSTDSYKSIFHWGSSPLIDHWWSTEKTDIFHDGSEVERVEKTANFLVNDSLAKQYLRVCLKNYGAETNCGKCTKCIRTMIPLVVVNQLKEFETFPDQMPKNWASILQIKDEHDLSHAEAILEQAQQSGTDKELVSALARKVETAKYKFFLKNQAPLSLTRSIITVHLAQPFLNTIGSWQRGLSKILMFAKRTTMRKILYYKWF